MKKKMILLSVSVLLLSLMMAMTGWCDGKFYYAAKQSVNCYEEKDKDSKVVTKLDGCTKVLVENEDDNWVGTLKKGSSEDGQSLMWIQKDDLSIDYPASLCPHDFGEWKVEQEATCNAPKIETRYCSLCGIMDEREGGFGDHKFGDWKVTKQATCQADGEKTRTCSVCGTQETQSIPKDNAHKFGNWTTVKEATCTAEGSRKRTCSICGKEETESIPKAAHQFGSFKELKKATCKEEGEKEHTCSVCGFKETQKIEKLPHDYETKIVTEATDHSAGVREKICKVCKHSEGKEEFDPEGTLRRGDTGEEVYRMQQLLADQKYLDAAGVDGQFGAGTEKALMAFQTAQGFTADGVCWPQTLKKLNHDFGPWETIRKMTRTTACERVRTCKDCGFEQHETIEPQPVIENGRRGEDVRAIQQILTMLGYDCGTIDGIYGQKLDAAFGSFAKDQEMEFEPGKVTAEQIDALVNAWIEEFSKNEEMKESTTGDPVNIALTVNPFTPETEDPSDDLMTFNWSVTNLGEEQCQFLLILLQYGDEADFQSDNIVMVLDGETLEELCKNSAKGTFFVSRELEKGTMNFTALAVTESDSVKWLSNTVTFERKAEDETEAETEIDIMTETEAETEALLG